MDPYVVFDCQKVLANPFALTLVAAARSRALRRGAEPRLDIHEASESDLALHEIAAGAFTQDELAALLPGWGGRISLPPPGPRLCESSSEGAAAPASRSRETVH